MTEHTASHPLHASRAGRRAAVFAATSLLLAAAACSSSDDTGEPGPITTPPPTAMRTTAAAPTDSPISGPPPTRTAEMTSHAALLSSVLESNHAAEEFVGARIALRGSDGTITEATAGTQTIDPAGPPVDVDVPWNVGSVTKTFVAVVVLQLADEGALDLDANIAGFFPELAGADVITPRHLLQHTSGLNDYVELREVTDDARRPWTPSELIAAAEAAGRVGAPGGSFRYSNTNYVVLGEIVQQVSGNTWADEVRTRIVEPLGLTSTAPITDSWSPGYQIVDGAFVDATSMEHPSLGGAAGGLQSNGRDLLTFVTALADGTLLSPPSQAAMQSFMPGHDYSRMGITHGYGLGLERYATDAVTVIGHLGTGLQSAFIGYDAEHGTAVAVMINTRNPESQGLMAIEALTAARQTG